MEYIGIETTQNINLEYKAASVGDRILATGFDMVVQVIWLVFVVLLFRSSDSKTLWLGIFSLPVMFYTLVGELFFNGQTPGKMVLKNRVVKLDGSELTVSNCMARWIFRIVDVFILWGTVGLFSIVFSKKSQRLGDIVAGTTVVKMSAKNMLEESNYVEVPDDYIPKFSHVHLLSDEDIQIVKEVLLMEGAGISKLVGEDSLLLKTRKAIQKKLVMDKIDMPSKEFLEYVLLDYNHLHQ